MRGERICDEVGSNVDRLLDATLVGVDGIVLNAGLEKTLVWADDEEYDEMCDILAVRECSGST
jgi:hypothetical protein